MAGKLLLVILITTTIAVHANPPWPTDINTWDMRQWEAMTPKEQEIFLAGLLLGTWTLAKAYDEASNTRELADKKEYFQQILYYSAKDVRQKLNQEDYKLSDLLWAIIYRLPSGDFTPSARGSYF